MIDDRPHAPPPRPPVWERCLPYGYLLSGLAWLVLVDVLPGWTLLAPALAFLVAGAFLLHRLGVQRAQLLRLQRAWHCDPEDFARHPAPLLQHDRIEGVVIAANAAACRLLRYPAGTLQGMQATALLAKPARNDAGSGQAATGLHCMHTGDGGQVLVEVHSIDGWLEGRMVRVSMLQDVSETDRIRGELAESNRELQAMARRLFSLQEDERRSISRDLHDDVGQAITAIKMSAHAAMDEDDAGRRREDLAEIVAVADTTVDKLRNLSMLLRPPQLDALGLEAALRWHAGVLFRSAPADLLLELEVNALPCRPAREIEQACFRIAQECLTNVLRHAHAGLVTLRLEDRGDGFLQLEVSDDGDGFEPEQAGGLGLVIMRERAQSAGGTLWIDTGPGRGTRVGLSLPYRLDLREERGGADA